MQIILANTRMNVQLNIHLSHDSAATNVRGGVSITTASCVVHLGIQQ